MSRTPPSRSRTPARSKTRSIPSWRVSRTISAWEPTGCPPGKLSNDPALTNNTGITIGGTFTVNLVDPGTDQDSRISLDELNLSNLTSIFNAGIDARFNIDGLLVSADAGVNTTLGSIK